MKSGVPQTERQKDKDREREKEGGTDSERDKKSDRIRFFYESKLSC